MMIMSLTLGSWQRVLLPERELYSADGGNIAVPFIIFALAIWLAAF